MAEVRFELQPALAFPWLHRGVVHLIDTDLSWQTRGRGVHEILLPLPQGAAALSEPAPTKASIRCGVGLAVTAGNRQHPALVDWYRQSGICGAAVAELAIRVIAPSPDRAVIRRKAVGVSGRDLSDPHAAERKHSLRYGAIKIVFVAELAKTVAPHAKALPSLVHARLWLYPAATPRMLVNGILLVVMTRTGSAALNNSLQYRPGAGMEAPKHGAIYRMRRTQEVFCLRRRE